MPKRLTQDEVEFYNTNGFLGPLDLLTPEEALATRRHVEEIETKFGTKIQKRAQIKAHLPFPFLYDLVSHPSLLDAVEDIIGPNILCWGSSFFQKEANDATFVSWHQDSFYYGLEPPDTLTAWVAISEASREAGCMRFLPGSHNQGIHQHEEVKSDKNLLSRGQTIPGVDESKAVYVPLKAGQFSFHKEDTLHASDPNTTGDRRIGLSIHYVSPEVKETAFPGASAILLRGEDKSGNWARDMKPKEDFDPACMAELDRVLTMYRTAPEARKESA